MNVLEVQNPGGDLRNNVDVLDQRQHKFIICIFLPRPIRQRQRQTKYNLPQIPVNFQMLLPILLLAKNRAHKIHRRRLKKRIIPRPRRLPQRPHRSFLTSSNRFRYGCSRDTKLQFIRKSLLNWSIDKVIRMSDPEVLYC